MVEKTITYTDYNGVERTETFRFNLSEAERLEMELTTTGGLSATVNKIIETQDVPALVKIFKDLLLKSYGEKSADGKRFIKNDELREAFSQTEAYSIMFMELALEADKATEFINGLVPKKSVNGAIDISKRPDAVPIKADG